MNPVRDNYKLFDLYCTAYWSNRLDWREASGPNKVLGSLSNVFITTQHLCIMLLYLSMIIRAHASATFN